MLYFYIYTVSMNIQPRALQGALRVFEGLYRFDSHEICCIPRGEKATLVLCGLGLSFRRLANTQCQSDAGS